MRIRRHQTSEIQFHYQIRPSCKQLLLKEDSYEQTNFAQKTQTQKVCQK